MRVDPSLGEIVGRIHAQSIARFDELHPTPYRARARSKKVAARICALISSSLAAVVAVATVLGLLGMPLNSLSEPVSLETAPAVRAASNASLAGARLYVPSLTCRAMACGAELIGVLGFALSWRLGRVSWLSVFGVAVALLSMIPIILCEILLFP